MLDVMETGMPISRFYQHGCSSLLIVMLIGLAREASLGCYQHSLKNRTGPAVELEKIRIGDPDSSLSAADRSRNRTGKNKLNWPVFVKKRVNQAVYRKPDGSMSFPEKPLDRLVFVRTSWG